MPSDNECPSVEVEAGNECIGPPSKVRRLDPQDMQVHADSSDNQAQEKDDDELELFVKDMAESDTKEGGRPSVKFVWYEDVVKDVAEVPEEENPKHQFGHNELGIPESVKLVPCKGQAKVWSFFYKLEVPIHKIVRTNRSIFDPEDHYNNVRVFDYLCRVCLDILLVRVYLSRMDNGGFQERVFSTAAHVQGENQCRMHFDMLEMRTLLCQNKDLIRAGVI